MFARPSLFDDRCPWSLFLFVHSCFSAAEVEAALVVDHSDMFLDMVLQVLTSRCVPFGFRQAHMLGTMVGMDQKDRYAVGKFCW